MSLHAQLSPEAQQRLSAQKRTSTLTSLLIAILLMVLIGLILMIVAIASITKFVPPYTVYSGTDETDSDPKLKKVQTSIQSKPSPPSLSMSKVIVVNSESPVAVPVPDFPTPDPSSNIGDGNDFGEGWGQGTGTGPGGPAGRIPTKFRKRCSKEDRISSLTESGGTPACEDAVVSSLRWLKSTQSPDGSWTNRPTSMTGLALLAYLGHCETAGSAEFGETVLRAITFLVNKSMKNNGKLADDLNEKHWPYEHAIATYALAEAYTLCVKTFQENIPNLEEAVMDAGQFLINSQHQSGGWDYGYSEDSTRGGDVSIVGWHMQALKACQYTGLDFANLRKCYKKGIDYLKRMQSADGALGYSSPNGLHGDGTTLAAVGALCFQIWDDAANREARKAVKFMDRKMNFAWNTPDADLYGHYYAVQAMINHGGKTWEKYNSMFRDEVLNNQSQDGSFKDLGGGQKVNAVGASFVGNSAMAKHYRTCLATLMLESYYRFLPSAGGGK